MNPKSISILFLLLILSFYVQAQEACNSCTGKSDWKSERKIIQIKDLKENPYNSIIKLNVKRYYNLLSDGFYGTASFIENDLIVTARHNVARKCFIQKMNYKLNGKTVQLKRRDFKVYYFERRSNINSDIALIKITNPEKVFPVNTLMQISPDITKRMVSDVHLSGYPCDYSGAEMIDKYTKKSKLIFDSSHKLVGYPLYTCTGDSGAPLWALKEGKYYLLGVHHGGHESIKEYKDAQYNISVLINKRMSEWINSIRSL